LRIPKALFLAILAASVSTASLLVVRLAAGTRSEAVAPGIAVPSLLALAALCAGLLAARTRPAIAWLASITASAIVTIDLAAVARTGRADLDDLAWRWLSIGICLAAVSATAISAGFAAERGRRLGSWVPIVGVVAIGAVLVASTLALADPAGAEFVDPIAPTGGTTDLIGTLNLVTRTFLIAVVALVILGSLGEVRPAARRASRRLAILRPSPVSVRERSAYVRAWLPAFVDEIAPGRSRARRAALTERSRLAREMHAEVVPAVRRAIAEAERDGSPEHLALSLRMILREVDALGRSAHAIQLEVGGLVPALEWLAERTEERSDAQVTIDLPDPGGNGHGQPPMEVSTAAFRVAGLALENVVRHAPDSRVRIVADARGDLIDLVITDDGPGIGPDARVEAALAGRRGLADMVAEASACGASVTVSDAAPGVGTTVRFLWPG
jgi:signal transduction histidine kinase